jgi:FtsP/CotA-like multicopper oxidase with cupredoxin domain
MSTAVGQQDAASPAQAWTVTPGRTRTYFIAADEVEWNYTPAGRNVSRLPLVEGEGVAQATRVNANGVIYEKAVYREYTDATFSTLKPRPAEWQHLGLLGPLIRAEVGDTIRVTFKNNTRIRWTSLHPHGLAYDKASEGALYGGGPTGGPAESGMVAPGGTRIYVWTVPERAGPTHGDTSSVLWSYHSHYVEGRDMNSGLLGPIIVSARGTTKPDGSPGDVDREFITAYAIFDETQSWLFEANAAKQRAFPLPYSASDPASRRPYLIYSINGLIEGNLPGLTVKVGERVRWYLFANTNDEDLHTAHWHGQTAVASHMRTDMVSLAPMGMAIADMVADTAGVWLVHCHSKDHFEGGMQALFTVVR